MDAYIATVLIWAPNFAPVNWAFCAGQQIAISQNNALFALIGTQYGGNGTTVFNLPDLRSRVPVGAGMGQAPGLTPYNIGVQAGVEAVTLNTTQMPIHNHTATGEIVAYNTPATSNQPQAGEVLAAGNFQSGPNVTQTRNYASTATNPVTLAQGSVSVQVGNQGGSQAHENRQPFLGIPFIICMNGIFPPRS